MHACAHRRGQGLQVSKHRNVSQIIERSLKIGQNFVDVVSSTAEQTNDLRV